MSLFDKTIQTIHENRNNVLEGKINCIPIPFIKLKEYLPGFIKGTNWIFSASSGIGKTQLTKYIIYKNFLYAKKNNIEIHSLYFALEESAEELMMSFISIHLYHKYKIEVDVLTLESMFDNKEKIVSDYVLKIIDQEAEFFRNFEEHLHIYETTANPTGIKIKVTEFAKERGFFEYEEIIINNEPVKTVKKYNPNNIDEYVFVYVDHLSLLEPEANKFKQADTLHSAMSLFSTSYSRRYFAKVLNYIPVLIQQQAAISEEKQYNNKGELNIDKLKPTLNTLADNKLTARDALFVLALFAPDRYNIKNYRGYDISVLKDNIRILTLLKNRKGRSNFEIPLLFNGNVNWFQELPYPQDLTEQFYQQFKKQKK